MSCYWSQPPGSRKMTALKAFSGSTSAGKRASRSIASTTFPRCAQASAPMSLISTSRNRYEPLPQIRTPVGQGCPKPADCKPIVSSPWSVVSGRGQWRGCPQPAATTSPSLIVGRTGVESPNTMLISAYSAYFAVPPSSL
jgi:hypothetical protein